MKTSAKERRQKFEKWISVDMLRATGALPYFMGGNDDGTPTRISNIMKNVDRKRLCLPLEESMENLPCDVCNKEAYLHLIYKDGISIYKCEECLHGKENTSKEESSKEEKKKA